MGVFPLNLWDTPNSRHGRSSSAGLGCQNTQVLMLSFQISTFIFPPVKWGKGILKPSCKQLQMSLHKYILSLFSLKKRKKKSFWCCCYLLLPRLFSGVIADKNLHHCRRNSSRTEINIVNVTYSTKTFANISEFQWQPEAHCTFLPCCSLKYRLIPHEIKCLYTSKLCLHTLTQINTGKSGLYAVVVFLLKDDP